MQPDAVTWGKGARQAHVQIAQIGGHIQQGVPSAEFQRLDRGVDSVGGIGRGDLEIVRPHGDRHRLGTSQFTDGRTVQLDLLAFDGHGFACLVHQTEFEHIAIAHEARHMQIARPAIDLARGADLLHRSGTHHHDPVGHRQGLVLVVRDVDGGAFQLAVDAADFGTHLDAQLGIQVGQRFVHQDHGRFDDDGPGDGDALLLATGQLARQLVFVAFQLHQRQCRLHAAGDFIFAYASHPQAETHIVADRHVGKQCVVLEHHAETALFGRQDVDAGVVQPDAAFGQRGQAGQAVQGGRFAAARRPQQGDEFTTLDVQAQVAQGGDGRTGSRVEFSSDGIQTQLLKRMIHDS